MGHRFVQIWPPSDKTLGGYLCATGRVGLTYEFAGQYLVNKAEIQMGMRIIINMARAIGLLRGELIEGEDPILFSDAMESVEVKAPCSGLFVTEDHKLCEPIEEGAVLGHILSDTDLNCVPIVAPKTGYLNAFGASRANCDVSLAAQHPYAEEGEMLARISWPKEA